MNNKTCGMNKRIQKGIFYILCLFSVSYFVGSDYRGAVNYLENTIIASDTMVRDMKRNGYHPRQALPSEPARRKIVQAARHEQFYSDNQKFLTDVMWWEAGCCLATPVFAVASALTWANHDVANAAYFCLYDVTSDKAKSLVGQLEKKIK